jgi:dGTPase
LGADRERSMSAIGELFRYFLADPDRLPEPYAEQAREMPPHRVVCDYIAGMTDGFFNRTYQQVFGA